MLPSVRLAASTVRPIVAPALSAAIATPIVTPVSVPRRGMAVSLSELKTRIVATNNVAKLTNVMKLVASSKLKTVEDALLKGRPFGVSLMNAVSSELEVDEDGNLISMEEGGEKKRRMYLIFTTDRGLCGGVNSSVARLSRSLLEHDIKEGHDVTAFLLGDKGRVQIGRDFPDETVHVIDQAFDKDVIYPLAAAIADKVVHHEFDELVMVFNYFQNAASFHTKVAIVSQVAGLGVGIPPPAFATYDVEPENNEEALLNMMEYSVAGSVYYALLESAACETSQRVTAMDSASTNAKDMVDRFTLIYNRARQAKITTELTEIISGAESLVEDGDDD